MACCPPDSRGAAAGPLPPPPMSHRLASSRAAVLTALACAASFAGGWWVRALRAVEDDYARLSAVDAGCPRSAATRDSLWQAALAQAAHEEPRELGRLTSLIVRRDHHEATVTWVAAPIDDEVRAEGYRVRLAWDAAARRWQATNCQFAQERRP